jgi:spore coat protein CotH
MLKFVVVYGVIILVASCGGDGNDEDGGSSWEDEYVACDVSNRTDADLPRRIQFSDDGLRLVTGKGEQDDFYYFSTVDNSDIKKMYLNFSQENWWEQLVDNYESETEIPATMIYDKGADLPRTLESRVGVRFKGETSYLFNTPNTSIGYEGEKKSFNISLDYEDVNQDIDGFKNLNLNCAWGDHTFMREVIYEHVNQTYIPSVSVNYVELYINEEYWGLYINSQQIDNNFYREWFTSTCGTNWRADAPTKSTTLGDFNTGYSTLNYLGDNAGDYTPYYTMKRYFASDPWDDLINVCRILEKTPASEADYEDIVGQYLDIDRALWFLAMEIIFGDEDSYVNKGGSDYYVYWDWTTGRLAPIEYDGNSILFRDGIVAG